MRRNRLRPAPSLTSRRLRPAASTYSRRIWKRSIVRDGCAPCKGGAFQWVQAPPGDRSPSTARIKVAPKYKRALLQDCQGNTDINAKSPSVFPGDNAAV